MPAKIRITDKDRDRLAEEIYETAKKRIANRRRHGFDREWDEIERQIQLIADRHKPNFERGEELQWLSMIEPSQQANAREVLTADSMRLLFPEDDTWYTAFAEVTEEWISAFEGTTVITFDGTEATVDPDQDTANLIVHGLIDHFHRAVDYQSEWDLLIGSAISHGTFAARGLQVERDIFTTDWRGTFAGKKKIPVLAPIPIRNFLLDDTAQHALHEGVEIRPMPIRQYWQHERDLKRAAARAPASEGWFKKVVANLEPEKNERPRETKDNNLFTDYHHRRGGGPMATAKDHIRLLEMEGDVFFTRSKKDDVFVPDVIVTVAVGGGGPKVVRWRDQTRPFGSYIDGVYQREDMETPYGSSPLMKGRPLQQFLAEMINQTADSGILNLAPPIAYDSSDVDAIADGGLVMQPWRQMKLKNPEAIKSLEVGNPDALANLVLLTIKMYEDQTGVNDPRRGGELKSHTTAFATDVGESRGVLRTATFARKTKRGPLRNWLYMLYELAKDSLGDGQDIYVNTRGVEGYIRLKKSMMPKRASFDVKGSSGGLSKREERAQKIEALNTLAGLQPLVVQLVQGGFKEQADGILNLWNEVAKDSPLVDPERFAPKPNPPNQGVGG